MAKAEVFLCGLESLSGANKGPVRIDVKKDKAEEGIKVADYEKWFKLDASAKGATDKCNIKSYEFLPTGKEGGPFQSDIIRLNNNGIVVTVANVDDKKGARF